MKRFLMLVGVAVVAAAMYVAASPASQQSGPTAQQFKALKAQVTSLSKTVKGLKKVVNDCVKIAIPINQFGDNSAAQTEGYNYSQPSGAGDFLTTALDVSSVSDTGAVWFTGVLAQNRTACTTDLGENVLRHNLAKAGFTAHQR
jgi:hypothetical protein